MKLNKSQLYFGISIATISIVLIWVMLRIWRPHGLLADEHTTYNLPQEAPAGAESLVPSSSLVQSVKQTIFDATFNAPINFYGIVTDENGVPIAGVKVFYIIGTSRFSGSPTLKGPVTDENGRFSILNERGPTLNVFVENANYHQTKSARQLFEYSPPIYASVEASPLPTKDNPSIFKLQRKGAVEPLLHQTSTIEMPMDGTTRSVNLMTDTAKNAAVMTFSLESDAGNLPINEFHPFKWKLLISTPNGGIVERKNSLSFLAPPGPYPNKEVFVDMTPSNGQDKWSSTAKREYFVSFSEFYALIRLEVSGEKGRIILESFLNPKEGSRNLEFGSVDKPKFP